MNITLTIAEIGVIIRAMESVYPHGSPEMAVAQELYDRVYTFLAPMGLDMYQKWCDEFHLDDHI